MKTFLVVGASKGIGEQVAMRLFAQGDTIIGISRTFADAVSVSWTLDVLTEQLPEYTEAIDGIVYCPGSINLKPFRALKPDDFRTDFEINTIGAVKVLQHFLPCLQKAQNASVVLFSTVAVQTGMAYHASVAAAKGAIEGITRSLAAEWAPKIRVNCIAPSLTDTTLAAKLLDTDAKREASAQRHPLKTLGESSHIAAMAGFLLSDEAAFMTGQIIKMDGGIIAVKS